MPIEKKDKVKSKVLINKSKAKIKTVQDTTIISSLTTCTKKNSTISTPSSSSLISDSNKNSIKIISTATNNISSFRNETEDNLIKTTNVTKSISDINSRIEDNKKENYKSIIKHSISSNTNGNINNDINLEKSNNQKELINKKNTTSITTTTATAIVNNTKEKNINSKNGVSDVKIKAITKNTINKNLDRKENHLLNNNSIHLNTINNNKNNIKNRHDKNISKIGIIHKENTISNNPSSPDITISSPNNNVNKEKKIKSNSTLTKTNFVTKTKIRKENEKKTSLIDEKRKKEIVKGKYPEKEEKILIDHSKNDKSMITTASSSKLNKISENKKERPINTLRKRVREDGSKTNSKNDEVSNERKAKRIKSNSPTSLNSTKSPNTCPHYLMPTENWKKRSMTVEKNNKTKLKSLKNAKENNIYPITKVKLKTKIIYTPLRNKGINSKNNNTNDTKINSLKSPINILTHNNNINNSTSTTITNDNNNSNKNNHHHHHNNTTNSNATKPGNNENDNNTKENLDNMYISAETLKNTSIDSFFADFPVNKKEKTIL